MNRQRMKTILGAPLLGLALLLAACGGATAEQDAAAPAVAEEAATTTDVEASDAQVTSVETGFAAAENQESHFDADDLEYDESEVVLINLDGTSASTDSADVAVDGTTITVAAAGTYSLSGTLTDGEVIVDAADADDVTLILDGVDITNSDGAAIAVMNADEAIILLAEGSTNRLTDGVSYTFPDAETDEPNATLYSAADLTIAGGGELTVSANYNDGITSKDGLAIESSVITVNAVDDGIRGKDYVIVDGSTINVDAGGDGMKSDNDEDSERGYVLISSGALDISAGDDGVQAATDVIMTGGQLAIDAGSDSDSGRAIQGDVMVAISGGEVDATATDDAIHSNNEVTIDGGVLTLAAGDDGVHGDLLVTINDGSITITDSYEGIEAEVIYINDGFIDITSNDDGINVASADAATTTDAVEPAVADDQPAGRPARGPGGAPGGDEGVGEHYVYINGGTTVITITENLAEQGDGIDANGHIVMTDGVVVISGATDTRNSALDYSGGSFEMTGGTLIGTNVDGRNSEGIGVGSSQASLYLTLGSTIDAETVVHVESADGDSLVTFQPANDYSVIVFSSPDLVDGESYDVFLGGTVAGEIATNLYESDAYTAGELAITATASL